MKTIRLPRRMRRFILATIDLLENKRVQRRLINVALGVALLALSHNMLDSAAPYGDNGALLISIPMGAISILKGVL